MKNTKTLLAGLLFVILLTSCDKINEVGKILEPRKVTDYENLTELEKIKGKITSFNRSDADQGIFEIRVTDEEEDDYVFYLNTTGKINTKYGEALDYSIAEKFNKVAESAKAERQNLEIAYKTSFIETASEIKEISEIQSIKIISENKIFEFGNKTLTITKQ
jgi:hypothetical protein